MPDPLTHEELRKMDAYWRAANYLSVGQIYLYDNPLLSEPLTLEHIKPRLLGHWGTTPGLNFIYVHLQPAHQEARPEHDLHRRPGPRRPGTGGQHLPRGHLQRVSIPNISQRRGGHEAAVQAILVSRAAFPATSRRKRPARFTKAANWATALLHAYGAVFDNPDLIAAAWWAMAKRRPARWPPAGIPTNSSIRCATARCCRSCI